MDTAITKEYLEELFLYEESTNLFIWKSRPQEQFKNERGFIMWNSRYPGKRAGTMVTPEAGITPHRVIRINGVAHSAVKLRRIMRGVNVDVF